MFRNSANLENDDSWRNLENGEILKAENWRKSCWSPCALNFRLGEPLVVSTWRGLAVDFTDR
jgi:hypothetical protein